MVRDHGTILLVSANPAFFHYADHILGEKFVLHEAVLCTGQSAGALGRAILDEVIATRQAQSRCPTATDNLAASFLQRLRQYCLAICNGLFRLIGASQRIKDGNDCAQVVLLDRELFPFGKENDFVGLQILPRTLRDQCPIIAIALHDHRGEDAEKAYDAGVRVVLPARFEVELAAAQFSAALEYDAWREKLQQLAVVRATRRFWFGLLAGVFFTLFAAPFSENGVAMCRRIRGWAFTSDSAQNPVDSTFLPLIAVCAGGKAENGRLGCVLDINNTGWLPIVGLRIHSIPVDLLAFEGLSVGQPLDRIDAHRNLRIKFSVRIAAAKKLCEFNPDRLRIGVGFAGRPKPAFFVNLPIKALLDMAQIPCPRGHPCWECLQQVAEEISHKHPE